MSLQHTKKRCNKTKKQKRKRVFIYLTKTVLDKQTEMRITRTIRDDADEDDMGME